jgi:hypothetical protein
MGQAQQKHRAVLIVEDDAELRHLTAALFEDEKVDTIECESAEAALAVMLIGGREVAMIFADVRLPGAMGGVDLAWEVKLRWPLLLTVDGRVASRGSGASSGHSAACWASWLTAAFASSVKASSVFFSSSNVSSRRLTACCRPSCSAHAFSVPYREIS